MGVETLTKRSDAQKVEGERRRGRLSMRMKDCDKGNLERVGGEWRTTARDRQSWRLVIDNWLVLSCWPQTLAGTVMLARNTDWCCHVGKNHWLVLSCWQQTLTGTVMLATNTDW